MIRRYAYYTREEYVAEEDKIRIKQKSSKNVQKPSHDWSVIKLGLLQHFSSYSALNASTSSQTFCRQLDYRRNNSLDNLDHPKQGSFIIQHIGNLGSFRERPAEE